MNLSEIARKLGQTQANVSAQVMILEEANLLEVVLGKNPFGGGLEKRCKAKELTLQL